MTKKQRQSILYLLLDVVAAFIAWLLYAHLRGELILSAGHLDSKQFLIGSIMTIYWVLTYAIAGLYQKPFRRSRIEELFAVFKWTLIGVIAFFFVVVLDTPLDPENIPFNTYRIYMTRLFLLQFGCSATLRMLLTSHTNIMIRKRKIGFPTLMVGCGEEALKIYERLEHTNRWLGYRFEGYICPRFRSQNQLDGQIPQVGTLEELLDISREKNIEEIIIALDKKESSLLPKVIELAGRSSANIKIVPGIYDYIVGTAKITHILGAPLIEIFPQIMSNWEKVAKRLFDIVISVLFLILFSPLYLILSICVKLDSPGPVIYKQERIGKDGKPFLMYKFRSMYQNAEKMGPSLSSTHDPRITRIGKFLRKTRLDEIPQFWNVLKGDMSIVGPRPERQYFIDKIVKKAPHYLHLHKVRPGITSWGQVKYGYASTVDEMIERLKYDVLYIEQMSLALDLKIMLYTIIVMLEGRGK